MFDEERNCGRMRGNQRDVATVGRLHALLNKHTTRYVGCNQFDVDITVVQGGEERVACANRVAGLHHCLHLGDVSLQRRCKRHVGGRSVRLDAVDSFRPRAHKRSVRRNQRLDVVLDGRIKIGRALAQRERDARGTRPKE
jgi:hypothetical protein